MHFRFHFYYIKVENEIAIDKFCTHEIEIAKELLLEPTAESLATANWSIQMICGVQRWSAAAKNAHAKHATRAKSHQHQQQQQQQRQLYGNRQV